MFAIERDRRIQVMFERGRIAPQIREDDTGKIMDLTDAAGMADPPRGLERFVHQAAGVIGIAQQPDRYA